MEIARIWREIAVGTRVLAFGEDSHALRLVCKHPDLRAVNANLIPRRFAGTRVFARCAKIFARGSRERAPIALLAKCEPMRLLCKPYGNRCFADAKRRVLLDG